MASAVVVDVVVGEVEVGVRTGGLIDVVDVVVWDGAGGG